MTATTPVIPIATEPMEESGEGDPAQALPRVVPVMTGTWERPLARARVIYVEVIEGGRLKVVVSAGRAEGVAPGWSATVIDAHDRPVPNGTITLTAVDARTSTGTVNLVPDQIHATTVILAPP
jgi:hypothetical protein